MRLKVRQAGNYIGAHKLFSDFGTKLTGESGILQLMDDLGRPLPQGIKTYALGGGNPAQIPEIEKMYRGEMERILSDGRTFEDLIGRYDAPQGKTQFIEAVSSYLSKTYGWNRSRNTAFWR